MKQRVLAHIALVLALLMLLPLVACSAGAKSESVASAPMAADKAMPEMEMTNALSYAEEKGITEDRAAADVSIRKIIYNAYMYVIADDPAKAMEAVLAENTALGGYLANSNTSSDDDGLSYVYLTLKVPAERLDQLVSAAEGVGKVKDYNLSSDDITLNYYDIEARLNTAKAEEKQLLTILESCTTVEEILQVRESLTAVRSDIESYQAQINAWDNLVAYATLELNIRRTPKSQESADRELLSIMKLDDLMEDISYGFQNSLRFIVNALGTVLIIVAVLIVPAGILFLCIGLPIILHKRRKKRLGIGKKDEKAQVILPKSDK